MKFALTLAALLCAGALFAADEPIQRYAAPEALGSGDGATPATAAAMRDRAFWKKVDAALKKAPVVVNVLPGEYVVTFDKNDPKASTAIDIIEVGSAENRLTIRGADGNRSLFKRNESDSRDTTDTKNFTNLVTLRGCRNILIEKLFFTGAGICGYGLQIRGSQDVTVRDCHWKNMPGVSYGASGANGRNGTDNPVFSARIRWENCTFDTVGYDAHAHMLYNANDCDDMVIRRCTFTDSTGDYIRFRNGGRNILVEECAFLDTGKYERVAPFIAMPLFVYSEDPAKAEHFAGVFTIRNNTFRFTRKGPRNWIFLIHISGFNPPGKEYLFSPADAARMKKLAPADARAFFQKRTGVDLAQIVLRNNRASGQIDTAVYECWPKYGSEKDRQPSVTSLTRLLPAAK